MNFYCIKYLTFIKIKNIKIKRDIYGKINRYFRCNDCGFKTFGTIDEKVFSDLLKVQTIYKTMFSYCLKCKEKTDSKNPTVVKRKNGKIMLLSNCAVCGSKKWFIKEQEVSGIGSLLKSVTKIPLVGLILF